MYTISSADDSVNNIQSRPSEAAFITNVCRAEFWGRLRLQPLEVTKELADLRRYTALDEPGNEADLRPARATTLGSRLSQLRQSDPFQYKRCRLVFQAMEGGDCDASDLEHITLKVDKKLDLDADDMAALVWGDTESALEDAAKNPQGHVAQEVARSCHHWLTHREPTPEEEYLWQQVDHPLFVKTLYENPARALAAFCGHTRGIETALIREVAELMAWDPKRHQTEIRALLSSVLGWPLQRVREAQKVAVKVRYLAELRKHGKSVIFYL
jgi:hypothetical protein